MSGDETRRASAGTSPDRPVGVADRERIARARRRAQCRWPLVGVWIRRRAVDALAAISHRPAAVASLLEIGENDPSPRLRERAQHALEALSGVAAMDALCDAAIDRASTLATAVCRDRNWAPSDPERRCLFLFVTGQLDAYFEEDDEFQALRLAYERADEPLRKRLLAILRGGDRRCLAFFTTRKPLGECRPREIEFALRSFLRHGDHERLFRAFLELPLKYGLRILHDLARTSWQPADAAEASLYRQVLEDSGGELPPRDTRARRRSEVFDRWLVRGRSAEWAERAVDDLVAALSFGTPMDHVACVAALACKASPGSEAARAVASHEHWMVRLAGHLTGLTIDVGVDHIDDPVARVAELAPRYPLLELPPGRATPALLESLSQTPGALRDGPLGAARRVLQTLMAHRMTTGSFAAMEVEIEAFDGEFAFVEDDGGDELVTDGGSSLLEDSATTRGERRP